MYVSFINVLNDFICSKCRYSDLPLKMLAVTLYVVFFRKFSILIIGVSAFQNENLCKYVKYSSNDS